MVMNFFCTKNHLDGWYAASGSDPDLYALSLAEALAVSRMLFGQ